MSCLMAGVKNQWKETMPRPLLEVIWYLLLSLWSLISTQLAPIALYDLSTVEGQQLRESSMLQPMAI